MLISGNLASYVCKSISTLVKLDWVCSVPEYCISKCSHLSSFIDSAAAPRVFISWHIIFPLAWPVKMSYKLSNGPWPGTGFMKNRQVAKGQAITISQIDCVWQDHFKLNNTFFSSPQKTWSKFRSVGWIEGLMTKQMLFIVCLLIM